MHQIWAAESKQTAMRPVTDSDKGVESMEPGLPSSEPKGDDVESDEPEAAPLRSGKHVQHLSIRISREKEGMLRNKLARFEKGTPKHAEAEARLDEQLLLQAELSAQRPSLPIHAPVEETELSGVLTYHDPHYKVVLDTIRIAALNAEADLAAELAEHMQKPAEAKKLLANIFAAPGDLRVSEKNVTLHLKIAARNDERQAITRLFQTINSLNLSLPGDPKSRPLRFKSDI